MESLLEFSEADKVICLLLIFLYKFERILSKKKKLNSVSINPPLKTERIRNERIDNNNKR